MGIENWGQGTGNREQGIEKDTVLVFVRGASFPAFRLLSSTARCCLPCAYCLLPSAYCLLLTAYCLLHATGGPRSDEGRHGRAVMMRQSPLAAATHKQISGFHQHRAEVGLDGRGYLLDAGNPCDVSHHVNQHTAEHDMHLGGSLEDGSKAFLDRLPAHQQVPTRVEATNPIFVPPHGVHAGDV